MSVDLSKMIDESRIIDIKGTQKEESLNELIDTICLSPLITDKETFARAIFEREKIISTGVGIGVAVPHVKIPVVKDFVASIGRSFKGVDFQALDEKPVNIIVMIGASDKQAGEFLKVLAGVVLKLKDKDFRRAVMLARSPEEIKELFCARDYSSLIQSSLKREMS